MKRYLTLIFLLKLQQLKDVKASAKYIIRKRFKIVELKISHYVIKKIT